MVIELVENNPGRPTPQSLGPLVEKGHLLLFGLSKVAVFWGMRSI